MQHLHACSVYGVQNSPSKVIFLSSRMFVASMRSSTSDIPTFMRRNASRRSAESMRPRKKKVGVQELYTFKLSYGQCTRYHVVILILPLRPVHMNRTHEPNKLGFTWFKLHTSRTHEPFKVHMSRTSSGSHGSQLAEGEGLGASLSFKMKQWSCYCIRESVCYWLEKREFYGYVTAKDSRHVTMKYRLNTQK